MRTRIKICGITTVEDALTAVRLGADAIGLIFADSPRQVTSGQACEIIRQLPPLVAVIGVFVNEESRVVKKLRRETGLHVAQLHGTEDAAYMAYLDLPSFKSFQVKDRSVLARIAEYHETAFLLDTFHVDKAGGTGATFDWSIAAEAKRYGRVILSGGLTPDNIADALTAVRPWAVDVSSGVERQPGIKDNEKMRLFIQKVHQWDSQTD